MASFMSLKPRMSEKSYGLSQVNRTYIFDVPSSANKLTVAKAVNAQYDVTVQSVNIANQSGKSKRSYVASRRQYVKGQRSDVKRAYVTLKEGDKLPIFAAEEEQEAKEQKAAEKASKKAKKEAK